MDDTQGKKLPQQAENVPVGAGEDVFSPLAGSSVTPDAASLSTLADQTALAPDHLSDPDPLDADMLLDIVPSTPAMNTAGKDTLQSGNSITKQQVFEAGRGGPGADWDPENEPPLTQQYLESLPVLDAEEMSVAPSSLAVEIPDVSHSPEPEPPLTEDYLGNLSVRDAEKVSIAPASLTRKEPPPDDIIESIAPALASYAEPSGSVSTASQAEIDALLAAMTMDAPQETMPAPPRPLEEPVASFESDDAPLTQEALDAYLAAQILQDQPASPPAQVMEDKPVATGTAAVLSQADLDLLLASMSAPTPLEDPSFDEDRNVTADAIPLSQEQIAQLLDGEETRTDAVEQSTEAPNQPFSMADFDTISQGELDKLIASAPERAPKAKLITMPDAAPSEDRPANLDINQSELDSLLAAMNDDPKSQESPHTPPPSIPAVANAATEAPFETPPAEEAKAAPEEVFEISQDMIDALIAEATGGEVKPAVMTSDRAVHEDKGQLSQDDLDGFLAAARETDKRRKEERRKAIELTLSQSNHPDVPAPNQDRPVSIKPKSKRAKHKMGMPRVPWDGIARLAAALILGTATGFSVHQTLNRHRDRTPELSELTRRAAGDVNLAMRRARPMIADEQYTDAIEELDSALAEATPGPAANDARHMLIDTLFRACLHGGSEAERAELHQQVGKALSDDPNHPMASHALYCEARLYEMEGISYAAHDIYTRIVTHYPDAPDQESILVDAAQMALDMRETQMAAENAQKLLRDFPNTPHRGRVRLILGDAYAMAGMNDDARTIYLRASEEKDADIRADAMLRLGRLALSGGHYDEAIRDLEQRLASSLSVRDNDQAHLLLARAYNEAKRGEDAKNILNDLIQFFPQSPLMPDALIELSQVLDRLGKRDEAVQIAQRAAGQYPENVGALKNKAEFLGITGSPYGAAGALMQADALGANDPGVLLKAARYYKTAGMADEARNAYGRLREKFAWSDEALTGGVEEARLIYDTGQVQRAVGQLEELLQATSTKPQHLQAMLTLADIYRDLGVDERLVVLAKDIATEATSPETLARAAIDLVDTGKVAEAEAILASLDLTQVQMKTAYGLKSKLGVRLLEIDPARGLDQLETAYLAYPEARQTAMNQRLLEAYLATDRLPQARRMVMDLAAQYREDATLGADLLKATLLWGNNLYDRKQYRDAAEAYALAGEVRPDAAGSAVEGTNGPHWAAFQRANALLAAGDSGESLRLFDEIVQGNGPWASEAKMLAEHLRAQQRLRGENLPKLAGQRS